ncbi:hypothetical protein EPI10_031592 [Gossypium australe]|uniref:Uncharacterized protein n=1 Tax=Gossypium australe TaxID=47621 RepID=A0A5B6X4G1_9ROSI|nr:hypothetical protein EPI10_031592 [Gossypium australe]
MPISWSSRLAATSDILIWIGWKPMGCQLIEEMTMNSYVWPADRSTYRAKPPIANVVNRENK